MLKPFKVYEHLSGVELRATVRKRSKFVSDTSEHGPTSVETSYNVGFWLEVPMILSPEGILRTHTHSKRYTKQNSIWYVGRIKIVAVKAEPVPYMRDFGTTPQHVNQHLLGMLTELTNGIGGLAVSMEDFQGQPTQVTDIVMYEQIIKGETFLTFV